MALNHCRFDAIKVCIVIIIVYLTRHKYGIGAFILQ